MSCPYVFCSATIEARWMRTQAERRGAEMLMVPPHDMVNQIVQGPCPASLMWIPIQLDSLALLKERARVHGNIIQERPQRTRPHRSRGTRKHGAGVTSPSALLRLLVYLTGSAESQ